MRIEIKGNIKIGTQGIDVDYVIVDFSRETNVVRQNTGLIYLDRSTNEKMFV